MRVFTKIREILTDNLSVRLEIEEIKKQLVNHSYLNAFTGLIRDAL